MAKAKTIHAQAKDNTGSTVFDLQLSGKKHKQGLLSQAITAIQSTGGLIRYQEVGAKSWAIYHVKPGRNVAIMNNRLQWDDEQ